MVVKVCDAQPLPGIPGHMLQDSTLVDLRRRFAIFWMRWDKTNPFLDGRIRWLPARKALFHTLGFIFTQHPRRFYEKSSGR